MGTASTLQALKTAHLERQRQEFLDGWNQRHGEAAGLDNGTFPPIGRTPESWTAAEAVMRAARTFPGPFGLSALVVAAWKLSPKLLGLPGCEEHFPSDRRVYATLAGKRGLVRRGFIDARLDGLYEVTEKGRVP